MNTSFSKQSFLIIYLRDVLDNDAESEELRDRLTTLQQEIFVDRQPFDPNFGTPEQQANCEANKMYSTHFIAHNRTEFAAILDTLKTGLAEEKAQLKALLEATKTDRGISPTSPKAPKQEPTPPASPTTRFPGTRQGGRR